MSVLDIFGQNLRNLTALRGSQSSVAQDLGIGRIQFRRYLRSESFPKPNVLQRVCEYFRVDARILTDLLTPEQLEMIGAGLYRTVTEPPVTAAIQEAVSYCIPDQDYYLGSDVFPDGIYQLWRGSFLRKDRAQQQLIQVRSLAGSRVVRGYTSPKLMPPTFCGPSRQREFRGILLRQFEGFAIVGFHAAPSGVVSILYLHMVDMGTAATATGICFLSRGEYEQGRRVVRTLMIKLERGWRDGVRAARAPALVPWEEVPDFVYPFIRPQDETF